MALFVAQYEHAGPALFLPRSACPSSLTATSASTLTVAYLKGDIKVQARKKGMLNIFNEALAYSSLLCENIIVSIIM